MSAKLTTERSHYPHLSAKLTCECTQKHCMESMRDRPHSSHTFPPLTCECAQETPGDGFRHSATHTKEKDILALSKFVLERRNTEHHRLLPLLFHETFTRVKPNASLLRVVLLFFLYFHPCCLTFYCMVDFVVDCFESSTRAKGINSLEILENSRI